MPKTDLLSILACPRSGHPLVSSPDGKFMTCTSPDCEYSRTGFPVLEGTPVLVDFEHSVLDRDFVMRSGAASTKRRKRPLITRIRRRLSTAPGPTEENVTRFLAALKARNPCPRVLVVGGGVVGTGARRLYEDPSVRIMGSDIYRSDLTELIADGHQLPFADGCMDGVWIQAVLEHVLEPQKVVDEIHRVLAPGGIVYAETPFMQQVHEGAYDFTRFTPSGHRWLFRSFDEVASGITRGPGTVLIWSIRYFSAAVFRSYKVGSAVSSLFFWLRFFDRVSGPGFALDGPSGVFFMGRRIDRAMLPREIISSYRGAQ